MRELRLTEREMLAHFQERETFLLVRPMSHWAEQVKELFHPTHETVTDPVLPWSKAHQFAFRPGEVTLWFGYNGHGKTLLQNMCMTSLAAQGHKVCIASFEMKPHKTAYRMKRQALRHPQPSVEALNEFDAWSDDKIWLYDQQGTVNPKVILAVIRHCGSVLGIKHFVIDSLMKCVKNDEDNDGQKQFVDQLTALARDLEMHLHLVHHVRKGQDEMSPPGKMDAKGSGTVTDLVDNVLVVWRNKKKEASIDAGKTDMIEHPDCFLTCEKQRHGEYEGRWKLWFDRATMQYVGDYQGRPQDLMAFGSESRWKVRHAA